MNADIAGQDRSYRRGLVLGFTLAEVAILIIFALLLALAWHVANKEKEIVTLRGALDRSEVVVAQLREQRRQLERSEEHTSELQSLMRISYAVFGLKKHNQPNR